MAPPEVCGSPARPSTATHRQPPSRISINAIPLGTVQRLRDEAEARIAAQGRETDTVLLRRAQGHASALRQSGRTYRQRLRVVAAVGLLNMGPSLTQFFHDHENMSRAVMRSNEIARRSRSSLDVDTLTYVEICIIVVRNRLSHQWITSTFSSRARHEMRTTGAPDADISTLRGLLEDEIVRIITTWDELSIRDLADYELNNVGPDHNIDDLGQDARGPGVQSETMVDVVSELRVDNPIPTSTSQDTKGTNNPLPSPPPSPSPIFASNGTVVDAIQVDDDHCCSICTEPYTERHRAFSLTRCGHTFGKACINEWVNSTARNANLCPNCRAMLCVRRPRRPMSGSHAVPLPDDRDYLQSRLNQSTRLIQRLADVRAGLWGLHTRNAFFDECMDGLNERFFTGGLSWILVPTDSGETWTLQPHDWHA
ncbi:hypothetical protein P171DRAFT_432355 [Karstenula rhodostoma CBS 690.94]|uniref:RING-type domain-containing protein n=1 Tax=Karstenula rhodostoma CBS 690.94 TaxID=1392251 RepID=A0A9P4PFV4_9PLEO|nr:hypothetical protein P171DRAFT_432355 [Karstenula rhodostoma CBS 690.94]